MSILANQSSILAPEVPAKAEEIPLLAAVKDDHGGVVVKLKNPMDSKVFLISLKASVANWRKQVIVLIMGDLHKLVFSFICAFLAPLFSMVSKLANAI